MDRAKVVVEQRGSHFVAWVADEAGKPRGTVLMVGRTAEEAEVRLTTWWAGAENR